MDQDQTSLKRTTGLRIGGHEANLEDAVHVACPYWETEYANTSAPNSGVRAGHTAPGGLSKYRCYGVRRILALR